MVGVDWGNTGLVPSIKWSVGTPLVGTGLVDHEVAARLRAVSVTTIEELLGLIAANPSAVIGFLPGIDLPQVQADGAVQGRSSILAKFDGFRGTKFAMGARFPADLDVERLASAGYAESWIAESLSSPAAQLETAREVVLDCFGPIRNQGDRGTCVAHAVCAVAECQEKRVTGASVDLSEQFVYWTAKSTTATRMEKGPGCTSACPSQNERARAWRRSGLTTPCRSSVLSRRGRRPPVRRRSRRPPATRAPRACAARRLADSRLARPGPSRRDRASGLRQLGIQSEHYDTTGLIPMPLPDSVLAGGHAMCATGYTWAPRFTAAATFRSQLVGDGTGLRTALPAPGYGALPFLYIDRYGAEAWTTDV